jgi:hypothetical protein
MPGFTPGIHGFVARESVDGRDKPGHDAVTAMPSGRIAR